MSTAPPLWMAAPFAVLLAIIALGPVLFPAWWLRHYAKVALSLGVATLACYLVARPGGTDRALHTAHEYISFIVLIGALFVVSGGIHISVKGEATPLVNVVFLLTGAVLANVLGTTGASMLLIRPWLRMNRYRVTGYHVVFFIFIVSNVGGCLTPIGDPPLFLGYLNGIPFWWVTEKLWPMWLVGVALLLAIFLVVDYRNYFRAPKEVRAQLAEAPDEWKLEGKRNAIFLAIILGAVFIKHPLFLREAIMIAATLGSWFLTPKQVHQTNHFNFHPIQEVAILFAGIFATMMPALEWLEHNARRMDTPTPAAFYWASGTLSGVLDNAPTYLSFLSATIGAFVDHENVQQVQQLIANNGAGLSLAPEAVRAAYAQLLQTHAGSLASGIPTPEIEIAFILSNPAISQLLVAISVGAVFFGANTYIGNGPNFMVKSIADHRKVHAPGFIAYIVHYTLPVMGPVLLVIWWLFFR
jgi:Na+/H+ antiporter NhaD/arsenite permease-like protein